MKIDEKDVLIVWKVEDRRETVDMADNVRIDFVADDIETYYDEQTIIYNFNSPDYFHYGMWDKGTKSPKEAQENTNRFIAEKLEFHENDIVLDAGCGIGGPAIFMAENYDVKITGITLSNHQVEFARRRAKKSAKSHLINFQRQDFTKANFPDGSFTKIYGMESICHSPHKLQFLQEAYRLLKDGGKILVEDAFVTKEKFSDKDRKMLTSFLEAWKVPYLANADKFEDDLRNVGFKNVRRTDISKNIMKSVQNIYINGIIVYPITKMLSLLKWIPKDFHKTVEGTMAQKYLIHNNVGIMAAMSAEKWSDNK